MTTIGAATSTISSQPPWWATTWAKRTELLATREDRTAIAG